MSKERLLNVALIVMGLSAVGTTALAFRARGNAAEALATETSRPVENWKSYLNPGTRIGPAEAELAIVEFSDFQCIHCKTNARNLETVQRMYPGRVAVVVRHFPVVDQHPHAYDAALSAECAAEQGLFENHRRALFRRQDSIGTVAWMDFARQAQVPDTLRFDRCMEQRLHAGRIESDLAAGRKLAFPATPTTIIDGQAFFGAIPLDRLQFLVSQALTNSKGARLNSAARTD